MGWRYFWGVRFGVLFLAVHGLCLINFCQTVDQPTDYWLECSNFKFWKFPNGGPGPGPGPPRNPFQVDQLKAHGVTRLTAINWGGPPRKLRAKWVVGLVLDWPTLEGFELRWLGPTWVSDIVNPSISSVVGPTWWETVLFRKLVHLLPGPLCTSQPIILVSNFEFFSFLPQFQLPNLLLFFLKLNRQISIHFPSM
jgi:hypothetical protein